MGKVLTENSAVNCAPTPSHGGAFSFLGAGKLRVAGVNVLSKADVLATTPTITSCPNVGSGRTPCTHVTSLTGGVAARLKVGGEPVVLDSLAGATDGKNPDGSLLLVDAANDRLRSE